MTGNMKKLSLMMMRQWVMTLKSVRSKLLKDLHLQKSNRYLDAYSSRTILDHEHGDISGLMRVIILIVVEL
jgi:hypothetical protein